MSSTVEVMVDNGIKYDKDRDWVPHTFLKLTDSSGNVTYAGFAPKETGLIGDGYIDTKIHLHDISSGPITISDAQADALKNYIDNSIANPPYYDLICGAQCTAWALDALSKSNIIPSVLAPDITVERPIFDLVETIMFNPYTQALGFQLNNIIDGFTDFISSFYTMDGDNAPSVAPLDPPRHDPLALDMDKDGFIDTYSLANSSAFFDITGDGIREKVGWIKDNDALLVYDKNENSCIDGIGEVFGNMTKSGFDELRQIADSNFDSKIDRRDELYNRLQLWSDKNADGISQESELTSLKQEGVVLIDLNAIETSIEVNGSMINEASHYTDTNNNLELVADVYLVFDAREVA